MKEYIYTFKLVPDWKLINELSQIDKFGGSWSSIEKREGKSLKQLKSIATVRSVGASTRIEGSKLTDDEVEILLKNIEVSKLEERDRQEVIGYFEVLDTISEAYKDIDITESSIKHLHNILMRHSKKDEWHKGNYKSQSNVVEATNQDGSKHIVFQTTAPGLATEEAMRKLIDWYNSDKETHTMVRSAIFIYDFLSIHPFQDGNGRLSRLLATLLLLRHGYSWIQYVSFEHEIESRKTEYYKVLMQCQSERPGEDLYTWVHFFLDCLNNIQNQLINKLGIQNSSAQMAPRERMVYTFIENHPGSKSGEISKKLDIPLPTVKRILTEMVEKKLLFKHGVSAGTNYTIESVSLIKADMIIKFTNDERKKELSLMSLGSFIEIKKIILTPLFQWAVPDDWSQKLVNQGLYLRVVSSNNKGEIREQPYSISSYNDPFYFQPVFNLSNPINIPMSLWQGSPSANEYPIKILIELISSVNKLDFDVMIVYDAAE